MPNKNSTIFFEQQVEIEQYIGNRSERMLAYMKEHSKSRFTLWHKTLTHSDLTNRGKRNGNKEGLDRNLLYYLSVKEMMNIQNNSEKEFESAKQSNIGLKEEFYNDLGIPRLKRRNGPQETQHEKVVLNDFVDVFIVNETAKYFTMPYTKMVLKALGKDADKWKDEDSISLKRGAQFTEIQITQAIHGLGTSSDIEFHKLRLSMFLNDTIIFLIEHCEGRNKLFILLS